MATGGARRNQPATSAAACARGPQLGFGRHTRGGKTRARPRAGRGRYWACRGPVLRPAFSGRNRCAFVWFRFFVSNPGVPDPTFFGVLPRVLPNQTEFFTQKCANIPTPTQQVVRHSFRFPGPFAHWASFRCGMFGTTPPEVKGGFALVARSRVMRSIRNNTAVAPMFGWAFGVCKANFRAGRPVGHSANPYVKFA